MERQWWLNKQTPWQCRYPTSSPPPPPRGESINMLNDSSEQNHTHKYRLAKVEAELWMTLLLVSWITVTASLSKKTTKNDVNSLCVWMSVWGIRLSKWVILLNASINKGQAGKVFMNEWIKRLEDGQRRARGHFSICEEPRIVMKWMCGCKKMLIATKPCRGFFSEERPRGASGRPGFERVKEYFGGWIQHLTATAYQCFCTSFCHFGTQQLTLLRWTALGLGNFLI